MDFTIANFNWKEEYVLLSGASGMLGSAIAHALQAKGARTLKLVRREANGPDEVRWNPTAPGGDLVAGQLEKLEGITAAVHLSGANIAAHRWTAAYKQELVESRVGVTRVLSEALARLKHPPRVLLAASAVGFYGDRAGEILDEDSAPGSGFLPDLCIAWEAATRPAQDAGVRVVHLRMSVVLGKTGGALARQLPLFRLGLGGNLGSGRQWMSWITDTDAIDSALFALANPALKGPVNAASPEPVTNAEFTRQLGIAVHRPALLTAPAFALRLALGEFADEALLASTRALPNRLLAAGFVFAEPSLSSALASVLAE